MKGCTGRLTLPLLFSPLIVASAAADPNESNSMGGGWSLCSQPRRKSEVA